MKLKSIHIVIVLSILLSSCGLRKKDPCPPVKVETTSETTREIETVLKDSTIKTTPESSQGVYDVIVDSSGSISVEKIASFENDALEEPSVEVIENRIYVDCTTKAQEIFLQWKEKYEKENKKETEIITLPAKEIVLPLTKAQLFLHYSGLIFWAILLALVGYRLYKLYTKNKLR